MDSLPPLVFVHGIKGSNLYKGKKCVYLTPSQLLSLDTPDLRIPLEWEGDLQASDGVRPGGPTENLLGCLSGFLGAQGYADFLKWGRKTYGKEQTVHGWLESETPEEVDTNKNFFVFTYDWRRDNNENATRLLSFLQALGQAKPLKPQIVAHSNGGLLTWHCINKAPQLASSIVFAGVPFGLSWSFLKDMHYGGSNGGFNKRHLTSEVYFTHPCYYSFFPVVAHDDAEKEDGSKYTDPKELLKDNSGNIVDFDVNDAGKWEELGFLLSKQPSVGDAERNHLQKCLDQAKLFREALVPKQDSYPPVVVLAGDSRDTRIGAFIDKETSVLEFDSWPPIKGDGRVALEGAKPPAGCPFTLVTTDQKHAMLLHDVATLTPDESTVSNTLSNVRYKVNPVSSFF